MEEEDYKFYYGVMRYSATGEGVTEIYYMSYAPSEEDFKKAMIEECGISDWFAIGIEVFSDITENTPPLIHQYYRTIKNACAGYLKFEIYFNYS